MSLRFFAGILMRIGWAIVGCAVLYATALRAETAPCRIDAFEGKSFTVCEFDLRNYQLKLLWKNKNGEAYGSLANVPRAESGRALVFATNGGMYRPDLSPVGLYVENGLELVRADTKSAGGNFYLKPNGIFFVRGDRAGILETSRYSRERPPADFATQSGPMLVIGGHLHPKFIAARISAKIRNGVGIAGADKAVFAISNEPVTFMEFAKLFRDHLHCTDALYLDGSISSIYAPSVRRTDSLWPLGPIIAIYARN